MKVLRLLLFSFLLMTFGADCWGQIDFDSQSICSMASDAGHGEPHSSDETEPKSVDCEVEDDLKVDILPSAPSIISGQENSLFPDKIKTIFLDSWQRPPRSS